MQRIDLEKCVLDYELLLIPWKCPLWSGAKGVIII